MNGDTTHELLTRIAHAIEGQSLQPLFVDVHGARRMLGGISESTLFKLVKCGDIPASVSIGGRKMWRVSDLESWASKLKR